MREPQLVMKHHLPPLTFPEDSSIDNIGSHGSKFDTTNCQPETVTIYQSAIEQEQKLNRHRDVPISLEHAMEPKLYIEPEIKSKLVRKQTNK